MSYLIDSNNPLINVKLTDYGRNQLASGKLNFNYYAFGDSEIDYNYGQTNTLPFKNLITNNNIISPKDGYNKLKSYLSPSITNTTATGILNFIGGNPLGGISPTSIEVNNEAPNRGFFTGTTAYTTSDFLIDYGTINNTQFSGGNQVNVTFSNILNGNTTAATYLMIAYNGRNTPNTLENLGVVESTPKQYLWYKVEDVTGTYPNQTVTLDRNTPNFSSFIGSSRCYLYPAGNSILNYYGSASTTNYWTPGTLTFDEPCLLSVDDVSVWNMNIVFYESVIGTQANNNDQLYTQYGSNEYNGLKTFFNFDGELYTQTPQMIGVIHYTNNSVSNYYGEYLNGNFVLSLPTIMYHRNSSGTMGLTLSANTSDTSKRQSDVNGFYYHNLEDGVSTSTSLGRVYPELKIAIITDCEILAAMTYKSNRNYTLPKMDVLPLQRTNSTLLSQNEAIWVTYMFDNPSAYTAGRTYGYKTALPCQYIQKISNPVARNPNTMDLTIDFANEFSFFANPSGLTTNKGFNGQRLLILWQKTALNAKPSPSAWLYKDITNKLPNSTSGVTKEDLVASNTPIILTLSDYTSSTLFSLNDFGFEIPNKNQSNDLVFGDEVFFYGSVNTNYSAKIYRTTFDCKAPQGKFNNSNNPTWRGTKTYISEVGVYDNTGNMVAIGKLNTPILKYNGEDDDVDKNLTIKLQIDF